MFEPQTSIRAFVNKLGIFVTRTKTGDFGLFPHYKEFLATTDGEMSFPSVKQDIVQYLTNLLVNFKERFPELEEVSYRHVQFPFRVDAEACGDLALEVAELQADENQKFQFEVSDLASFWLNAPKKYTCLKMKLQKLLFSLGPCMCVKQHFHAWCTSSQSIETHSLTLICKTTWLLQLPHMSHASESLLCEPSTHLFCQTDLGADWVYHFVTLLSNYFGTSVFHFRVWSEVSTLK